MGPGWEQQLIIQVYSHRLSMRLCKGLVSPKQAAAVESGRRPDVRASAASNEQVLPFPCYQDF